jgi:hypothetical protein
MGHWCRICDHNRANEKFSAKGHKNHVCIDCAKKPKEEIEIIDQEQEIFRYLNQSNISAKNLSRLELLAKSQNQRIAELAEIVLEVGRIKPHKRRRLKFLASGHRELLLKLDAIGLIMAHHDG